VQDLLVCWPCLQQALLPFLDPTQRHAHRLGVLGLRPAGMLSHQAAQISSRRVVFCFHDGTFWLDRLILPAVYRSCSFPHKATTWGKEQRSRGWELIHLPFLIIAQQEKKTSVNAKCMVGRSSIFSACGCCMPLNLFHHAKCYGALKLSQ